MRFHAFILLAAAMIFVGCGSSSKNGNPAPTRSHNATLTPNAQNLESDNSTFNLPVSTRLRVLCDGTTRIYLYSEEPSQNAAGAAIAIIPNDPRCGTNSTIPGSGP